MDIFAQKKCLVITVIVLAVLNISFISFFFLKDAFYAQNQKPFDKNDFKNVSKILEKELNLSKTQVEKIETLRKDFFKSEKLLSEEIKNKRDSMNTAMFNKTINDSLVISLARRIADAEYKMELLRYKQAQKFRSICTPEQLDKFGKLVKEIRDYFRPADKPKPRK
ncbi:MAG: hypothetical protein WCR42_00130 [bacterium]